MRLTIDEITLITNQTRASQSDTNDQVQRILQEVCLLTAIVNRDTSPQMVLEEAVPEAQQGISSAPSQSSVQSGFDVRAYIPSQRQNRCRAYYKCKCHDETALKWNPFLKSVIGRLFAGYSGNPFNMAPQCTTVSCKTGLKFSAYVHYYFPSWYLGKVLDVEIISRVFQEPKVTLTVRGMQPTGGKMNMAIFFGDAKTVKELLVRGLAMPNDIIQYAESTILQVSFSMRGVK